MFRTDAVIPPDPDGLDVLHDRDYRVRAYKLADDRLLIPGAVRARRHPVHANLNTCQCGPKTVNRLPASATVVRWRCR
jgi:hypothetical protein